MGRMKEEMLRRINGIYEYMTEEMHDVLLERKASNIITDQAYKDKLTLMALSAAEDRFIPIETSDARGIIEELLDAYEL